jgi:hypothetical protein
LVVEEVQPQEEKETSLEEKVQVVDSDLTETPREGGFGGSSAPREGGFGGRSSAPELKDLQTEHQDVLKASVIHLDQEDQEETNI